MIGRRIEIKCPECGHTKWEHPNNVHDDSFVKCNSCKLEIQFADLKKGISPKIKEAMDSNVENMVQQLKKSLKVNH